MTIVGDLARAVRDQWVVAALLAGPLLLAMTPALSVDWPAWLLFTWLHLPAYMLHQVEEHAGDRFRRFVNANLGGGREALTPLGVAVINIPGVWVVDAAAFCLAILVRPGLGLIAVYLSLVNAVAHLASAVALRAPNPGLVTAVVVFLPLSVASLLAFRGVEGVGIGDHALGLAVALAIHAAIIVHVRLRLARMR